MIDGYNRLSGSGLNELAEQTEMAGVPGRTAVAKDWPSLLPGERAASLPQAEAPSEPAIALLAGMIDRRCSVDSVAWTGDPVPLMRSLQKKLIEHSLTQSETERRPCLDAIRVIELSVTWRLRWQQMRRSELEGESGSQPGAEADQPYDVIEGPLEEPDYEAEETA